MSLLKISIHKSELPALLNMVPQEQMHIQDFKESDEKGHHHLRREHQLSEDLDLIEQKVNEIEENLIFYFQKMQIDPDEIKPPSPEKRVSLQISSVKDGVDKLHETVGNEIRQLKGYLNDKERNTKEKNKLEILKKIVNWTEQFNANRIAFEWFEQLKFKIYFINHENFDELEVALEHEEIPLVFEYTEINEKFTAFFMIYHHSYDEVLTNICHSATEIENYPQYFDDEGASLGKIQEKIDQHSERIKNAEEFIQNQKSNSHKFRGYLEILQNFKKYNKLEEQFRENYRGDIVRLRAYIPTKRQDEILTALDDQFHSKIRIYAEPMLHNVNPTADHIKAIGTEEEEYEFSEKEAEIARKEAPTLVNLPKIIRPFRILTDMYGVTNYNELDPTLLVAITYPILFGLMFGDVGHGSVILLCGLLLIFIKRKKKNSNMYDAGFLLMWLGLASIGAGFLYGQIFGNDNIITPLFVSPIQEITTLLKAAILVGVVHLNIGFLMQFFNFIKNHKVFLAFMEPFWKIVLLCGGAYIIFTYSFDIVAWVSPNSAIPYPILLVILPAIPILFGKPIGKVLGISYLQKESIGELIGEQTVDVGETYLSMLSNVASYSRLLALTMAHVGLMLVVTIIVDMLHSVILTALALVIGNLFVIVMESVIAAIHALRLTFYEFFGKFYLADGIPYEYTKIDDEFSEIVFAS